MLRGGLRRHGVVRQRILRFLKGSWECVVWFSFVTFLEFNLDLLWEGINGGVRLYRWCVVRSFSVLFLVFCSFAWYKKATERVERRGLEVENPSLKTLLCMKRQTNIWSIFYRFVISVCYSVFCFFL